MNIKAVSECSSSLVENMVKVLQSSTTANVNVVISVSLVWTNQEVFKIMKEAMTEYQNTEPGLKESRFFVFWVTDRWDPMGGSSEGQRSLRKLAGLWGGHPSSTRTGSSGTQSQEKEEMHQETRPAWVSRGVRKTEHRRWGQSQATKEEFTSTAIGVVSQKTNATWSWDLQELTKATRKASTTRLAIISRIRNMWANSWMGLVI